MFQIDELLSKRNQREAFAHFANKRDSQGPDGMKVSDLENYWKLNGERIIREIKEGTYEPAVMECYEVWNGKGKKREITNLAVIDRFIARLLAQKLRRYLEPQFLPNSFAYQENKGILDAVQQAQKYMEQGKLNLVEIDLKDYFDTVSLEKLSQLLEQQISDMTVLNLLKKYLYCKIKKDNRIEEKTVGLVQGNSFSPILSNLYLHSFDCFLEEQGMAWMRFADNIYIFVEDREQAVEIYNRVCGKLSTEYALKVNTGKSGIYDALERRILGYEFYKRKGKIEICKYKYKQVETYHNWHASVVQKVNREYHIVQDGILNKKDYSLLFENPEEKHHIPVEVVEQLNLYGEVTLTTGVLKTLAEKKVRCAVFDKYGMLEGYFVPGEYTGAAEALLNQCRLYGDERKRLELEKQLEIAGLHNMRSNIRYYYKKDSKEDLKQIIDGLSACIEQTNTGKSVEELMLIEARARQNYYSAFNVILQKEEFFFGKRTKQPPMDPMNALISFGNTLLYNQFLQIIWKSSLDPRIGVVHATNQRSHSLNLDFADVYKPVIVDRVIFSLVNLYQLKAAEDFEQGNNGGIYLNRRGKKTVLEQFEQKLADKITVKGKEYTYRQLMEDEVRRFQRFVMKEEKYRPYKYY